MTKKRILPPDRLAECEAAHELFLSKKNELSLSQKKIADAAGMTPAAVNLYFKGINPLNAKFATVLARLLEVPVESFSPRLANEIRGLRAQPTETGAAEKVMAMLKQHAGKSLDDAVRRKIADAVVDGLTDTTTAPPADNVIVADFSRRPLVGDEIRIAHYDVQGAMGNGKLVHDFPEMFRDVTVSQQHLRELGVTYKDPAHLKLITGVGQSMAPTIQDKDPLIVDASIREFVGDGIYAFTWQGHFYIKSLQVVDAEHFKMISKAEELYPPVEIRIDETYIQARVLLVWNAKRL
ncbi:LexA family transcriptional regulator [Ectopseudomonas khazarica]|uniref:LexA family transcriptional regulator n=1 Tax=Ectopseudomonas khazarica TaxID=2502979 RepID=UPI0040341DCB